MLHYNIAVYLSSPPKSDGEEIMSLLINYYLLRNTSLK